MHRLFILFFLSLFTGCSALTTVPASEVVGTSMAHVGVTFIDHTYHRLSEFKGKSVVIIFWDAHCPHCRQLIPQVEDLAKNFADRSQVVFLAVSVNTIKDEQDVKDAIFDLSLDSMLHGFSGNDVYDETYQAFSGSAVPYVALLDGQGSVQWIGNDARSLKAEIIHAVSAR